MKYHEPVMVKEILEFLRVKKGGKYIDCTLGDGGVSLEILRLGGIVLGIDINEESFKRAKDRIKSENFKLALGNFKNVENLAKGKGFEKVNGIIFDLGYSSYELDNGALGLSFQADGPLDMRLSKDLSVTAADLINALSENELERLISEYGEERFAKRIAKAIVGFRRLKKFQTTKDLADLIVGETPPGYERGRIHPATRTFLALRIVVNDDLNNLSIALPRAAHLLLPGGRMIVISFHSFEDRVAKNFGNIARPSMKVITDKPVLPSDDEVARNKRSRSAKMRVYEKK